jgi:hypothetical protein
LKYRELFEKLEANRTSPKFDPKSIVSGSTSAELDQSYNLIECQYYIANCFFSLGKYKDCTLACEKTLNSNYSEQIKKRQKGRLKSIERLLEKAKRLSQGKG